MRANLDPPTAEHGYTVPVADAPVGLPGETFAPVRAERAPASPPKTGTGTVYPWSAVARQSGIALLDQAVISAASFFTNVILARLCDPESFGDYFLAFATVILVQGIQERLISTPYTIYCNRRRPGAPDLASYRGSVLIHQILLCLASGIGLLGLSAFFAATGIQRSLAPVMAVLIGALPLLMLRSFVRLLLIAHLEMATAMVIDIAVAAIQLGGLLLLGKLGFLTVPSAFLVMGGASGAVAAAWFLLKRPALQFARLRAIEDWRQNWSFAKWVVASNLAGSLAGYFLLWILKGIHHAPAEALWGACATLAGLSNMFVAGLESYLTPKAARAYSQQGIAGLVTVLWKSSLFLAVLLGSLCGFFYIAGEPIAAIVYKGKYPGAGLIVTLLAVGVLINTLGNSAGRGLWILNRPRDNFLPDATISLVTIMTLLVLVQPLGVLGAAIATVTGSLAGAVFRTWCLVRLVRSVRADGGLREGI
jgi:O-antigen/teichoic acid export membrane protein